MIYRDFKDKKLSLLGFGAMRLPLLESGLIDEQQVQEMTKYAIDHGVNYFDTAYPYHSGQSEYVMGRVLKSFPRESYYLATKYPGHQILSDGYNPALIFEEQLQKCDVDYFDFYLLHNINERSIDTYLDERWGIIDYFKEQKRLGRIKHLGFSAHAGLECLKRFLDLYKDDMEFCQIQMNYLDWTLQDAKEKYELLKEYNIPVWIMEPVRGGKLAKLNEEVEAKLKALRPNESIAAWSFRYLQQFDNITMILSGMSNMDQMKDNIQTFQEFKPTNSEETALLLEIAEGMKNSVPCTECRYCTKDCPMQLDIPMFLKAYNELNIAPSITAAAPIHLLDDSQKPSACIGCGACRQICPQNIDIPSTLNRLSEILDTIPSWQQICKEREEASKKK